MLIIQAGQVDEDTADRPLPEERALVENGRFDRWLSHSCHPLTVPLSCCIVSTP